jgi:hypothetical protein
MTYYAVIKFTGVEDQPNLAEFLTESLVEYTPGLTQVDEVLLVRGDHDLASELQKALTEG